MENEDSRPSPDELLSRIAEGEAERKRAHLKIFLGMSAGVGKTYAMLQEARAARDRGLDVLVGLAETHGRAETDALLSGLPALPRRRVDYRGIVLEELDLDALIARRPAVAVVDELAHENAPGSRHVKRWQDVEELLEKGISVWTAMNIQHLESYADVVEDLAGAPVRERVPDTVFDRADELRIIDIAPEDLIRRLEEGRVYTGDSSRAALENFFTPVNLGALREITLRYATRAASRKLTSYARAEYEKPSEASLGEKLLVAVGDAPNSAHIVRWTRRTAYALRADWLALTVETGAPARPGARQRLEENLGLARRLGAEVLTVRSSDIPSAVVGVARAKGVSMIVVGRSGLRRFGALRRSSISERIMREAAPIDVALVQDSAAKVREGPLAALSRAFGAPPREYGLLLASFLALIGLGEALSPFVGYRGLALVFLAAVLGLSLVARPILVAALAVLSALALNFLFIPPLYTLSIGKPEDWLLFAVYFLTAFVTSALASRSRAKESLLRERERAAQFLFDASDLLSSSRSEAEAVDAASAFLKAHYGPESAVLVDDGKGILVRPEGSGLEERDFDAASYAYAEGRICGARSDTLPAERYRFVPAALETGTVGVLCVQPPDPLWSAQDDELLQSLGRTLALALLRMRSAQSSREASLRLESDRLGGILLDSVSHELRTPLTAITGALSALRDDSLASRPETRRDLVENALEQADALNCAVEDILSLSRIESGQLRLKRSRTDLPDLASASIERAGPELRERRVEVSAPEEAWAFVDGALVARLAANLLKNAARYSPEGSAIELGLSVEGGERPLLRLRVRDHGPGIPPDEIPRIFDKFIRGRESRGKGLGLGLAICKGIAQVHGGTVSARNAEGGGFEVEARIPCAEGDRP